MLFRSCPRCGGENVGIEDTDDANSMVVCYECDHEGTITDTEALAVEAWNAAARGAGVGQ